MAESTQISVGLDLGSTRVTMAIVQQQGDNLPELLGYASENCRFLKAGRVINLEAMQTATAVCVKQIHNLTRSPIQNVTVNFPGEQLCHETGQVSMELPRKRVIQRKHMVQIRRITRLLDDPDWEMVHSIPESYSLDDEIDLASPVGMTGKTLSARVHQIYAIRQTVENIVQSVNRCRLGIRHLVADPLAQLESLITPDEAELGICLVDIGGSTIRLAAIRHQTLHILPPIPIGGDHITSDLAIGLRTPTKEAEKIKINHGCALPQLADEDRVIKVMPLGGGQPDTTITSHRLAEIIHPRVEEIFEMVTEKMQQMLDLNGFSGGVILTGGGSMMPGMSELAETALQLPVIKTNLRQINGLTDIAPAPLSAGAVGLALYGLRNPVDTRWGEAGGRSIFSIFQKAFNWLGGDRNR